MEVVLGPACITLTAFLTMIVAFSFGVIVEEGANLAVVFSEVFFASFTRFIFLLG